MAWQSEKDKEKTTYYVPAECRLDLKLCPEVIAFLDEKVADLASIQRTVWHLVNKKVFALKHEFNKYLQAGFHIKERTANSIISDMEARHASLLELKKRELEELDIRIARTESLIEDLKEYLDIMTPHAARNNLTGCALAEYRSKKREIYCQKQKLNRMQNQRPALQSQIDSGVLSICFGTKALFRKQYDLKKAGFRNHEEWLAAFRKNRDKNAYYVGRKEEISGNQQCQLTPTEANDIFRITVLESDKDITVGAQGFVRFSYCLGEVIRQLKLQEEKSVFRQPMTARFVRRKKGWYLILSLKADKTPVATGNRSRGVVSLDFNYSFIELTELNHHGNIINKIHLDIPHAGKTASGIHETRAVIKTAVQYAKERNKPLTVEDLDFTKKRARLLKKRAIRYNEMLSSLNYGQYKEALISRCQKDGVELIVVSPAYTTQTGKKYMEARHLTGHEAAAWQIGRRGMGFWLNKQKSVKQKACEKKARQDIRAKAKAKAKVKKEKEKEAKRAQARKPAQRKSKAGRKTEQAAVTA